MTEPASSQAGVKSPSAKRAQSRQNRTTRQPPAPSPTRSIQVGGEHLKVAEILLRTLQAKAARAGISLDVGQFPSYTGHANDGDVDPERPTRLLAHAVARAADRIGPLRRVSRHLEGTESRAGLVSDLVAEGYELYARNTEALDQLAAEYMRAVRDKALTRRAAAQAAGGGDRKSRLRRRPDSPQPPHYGGI